MGTAILGVPEGMPWNCLKFQAHQKKVYAWKLLYFQARLKIVGAPEDSEVWELQIKITYI